MVTIQHRIILSPFKRQSTNQYMIVSCVYQISVWTRSQILMLRSKPFTTASLFYPLCNAMIFSCKVFFSLHFGNKSLSLLPRRAESSFFCDHMLFFCFVFCFLLLLLFFLGGLKLKLSCCEFHEFYLLEIPWDYSCLQKCRCLQPLIFTWDNSIRFNQSINFSCSHSSFFMSDYNNCRATDCFTETKSLIHSCSG